MFLYMNSHIECRLKRHYGSYEPTLQQLKQKYEAVMKERMLAKLERDRAVNQVRITMTKVLCCQR